MQRLFIGCLLGLASTAGAQPVAFESVRLAETIMVSGWSTAEQSLPLVIAGFESQLKASGVTERAAKIFSEELRLSMSRENLSKAYAVAITAKLTPEEILEVNGFLQSKAGQKYLGLSKDFATSPALVQPIAKQACNGAIQRLEAGTDRSSISNVCSRL